MSLSLIIVFNVGVATLLAWILAMAMAGPGRPRPLHRYRPQAHHSLPAAIKPGRANAEAAADHKLLIGRQVLAPIIRNRCISSLQAGS
jgi:hypothetical protein